MLTRSKRNRLLPLPIDCWILVLGNLSAYHRRTARMLSRSLSGCIPVEKLPDDSYTYIIAHGRIFLRASCFNEVWKIRCIDCNDGQLHTTRNIRHLSKRVLTGSFERYRCGPLRIRLRLNVSCDIMWHVRTGDFEYSWPMDAKMNNVLRSYYGCRQNP